MGETEAEAPDRVPQYRELYSLATSIHEEARDRFARLDEKAMRYLSALTAVLGASGYFWIGRGGSPSSASALTQLSVDVLGGLAALAFLAAWFMSLRVLRVADFEEPPLTNELIDFMGGEELPAVFYGLATKYQSAVQRNDAVNARKARDLEWVHRSLAGGVVLLVSASVVAALGSLWECSLKCLLR